MTIGTSEPRIDGPAKASGAARYPADLAPRESLFAQVVFSGRPHARMVRMDTRRAEAQPGVCAVLTAKDVPRNAYGLVRRDQPVLVGVGEPAEGGLATDVSRWEGDQIAVVVADSERRAREAAACLDVEWHDLPVVTDVDAALTGEPRVHPEHPSGGNAYEHVRIRKTAGGTTGPSRDLVVVEGVYTLPHQEHAYLQPEAALAYVDVQGRVTVEVAGQWAHRDREQIARALDLPPDRVRVRYPAIGGAFGGREDVSIQIVMALAAWQLSRRGETRPVRTVWSREESIVGHHKGHWLRIAARWAARRDGRLASLDARVDLDAGAYNYTSDVLLRNVMTYLAGPYEVPQVRADGFAIYTNNVPGGALRGFGAPQACFAAESQMNKLAAALEIDPVALRRRNVLGDGGRGITGAPLPDGVRLAGVIDACAARASPPPAEAPTLSGFRSLPPEPAALRRGRGFACGLKNVGYSFGSREQCEVDLELCGRDRIERVVVRFAGAEVGQGAHSVACRMAAAAVGVPADRVELVASDTARTADAGSASASRLTLMAGNAIREAAAAARARWEAGARPAAARGCYVAPPTEPLDPATGRSAPHVTFGAVAESVELTVDVETGHVEVARVVCASDAGRAIDPVLVTGQVEGAVAQAYGGAVLERLRIESGRIANPRLSEYLIPGIGDVPRSVESLVVESPEPLGPWGARGVGEMPFVPLAAAIVAAVHDATGVWIDELPLTPERVAAKLAAAGVAG